MATSQFSLASIPYPLNFTNKKIGIAIAEWNSHVTKKMLEGALETLLANKVDISLTKQLWVPGAFELPAAAQSLFEIGYDAVICLGCVIQGDTPHFDYVCQATSNGIMRIGLDYKKPCIFGVLTTLDEKQARDRAGGDLGNKGSEAAIAALWMLAAAQQ